MWFLVTACALLSQDPPPTCGDGIPETPLYVDADGDGAGAGDPVQACLGVGFVTRNDDCDDGDRGVGAPVIRYEDRDGDGFGSEPVPDCPGSDSSVALPGDCEDTDPSRNPVAEETCDGVDNDCDGLVDDLDENVVGAPTWFPDLDGDGWGDGVAFSACAAAQGAEVEGDCDDAEPAINPGEAELCDGLDNDCDGTTDLDAMDATAWFEDGDGDGWGGVALGARCERPGSAVGADGDCDDADGAVHPDALEVCDGVDDDCDGYIDDADVVDGRARWYRDGDGDGWGGASWVDRCDRPAGYAADTGDCDDGDPSTSPSASEVCGGGDEDCDGSVDTDDPSLVDGRIAYPDRDGDGYGVLPAEATCAASGYVSTGDDCDDVDATAHPEADERCNGVDDDCDGQVDDADASLVDPVSWYADGDGDGWGAGDAVVACELPGGVTRAGDCDDTRNDLNPGASETCDGEDNDCDDEVDRDDDSMADRCYGTLTVTWTPTLTGTMDAVTTWYRSSDTESAAMAAWDGSVVESTVATVTLAVTVPEGGYVRYAHEALQGTTIEYSCASTSAYEVDDAFSGTHLVTFEDAAGTSCTVTAAVYRKVAGTADGCEGLVGPVTCP